MTAALLLLAIALSACYSPGSERACTIRCTAGSPCPEGFVCSNGNACAPRGEVCPPPNDAAVDADPDALDGAVCWGHGVAPFLELCPTFPFPPTLTLPANINTDTDCMERLDQGRLGAPELCVFAAGVLTVSGTVVVRGPRPLLLLGGTAVFVEVGALLDVASRSGISVRPAGAPGPDCGVGNGGSNPTSMSGGGGAGGSFGAQGGAGGAGGAGTAAGAGAVAPPAVGFLRGGCNGGDGGTGGLGGGIGGGAGGAVYLMARDLIRIEGTINASGAGADAAKPRAGGGGGGSGGMIVIDANSVAISATGGVFALAGGGASGGNATAGGNSGWDPVGLGLYAGPSSPIAATAGIGGAGGGPLLGGAGTLASGSTGSGGGGGGGGGGVIRIWPSGAYQRVDPPAPL